MTFSLDTTRSLTSWTPEGKSPLIISCLTLVLLVYRSAYLIDPSAASRIAHQHSTVSQKRRSLKNIWQTRCATLCDILQVERAEAVCGSATLKYSSHSQSSRLRNLNTHRGRIRQLLNGWSRTHKCARTSRTPVQRCHVAHWAPEVAHPATSTFTWSMSNHDSREYHIAVIGSGGVGKSCLTGS